MLTVSVSCLIPSLFPTVPPFLTSYLVEYSGDAAIPERQWPEYPLSFPRIRRSFRLGLIDWHYLGNIWRQPDASSGEVGLSSVNVVSHCIQAIPPNTLVVLPP